MLSGEMESSQNSFYTWLEQGLCSLKTQDQPIYSSRWSLRLLKENEMERRWSLRLWLLGPHCWVLVESR